MIRVEHEPLWRRIERRSPCSLPWWINLLVIATLIPIWWFPWRWPLVTAMSLPAIPVVWLWAWRSTGQLTARTGIEPPLVYVFFATVVATIPIVDWELGLPKVLGMVTGAAFMLAVGQTVSSRRIVAGAIMVTAALVLVLITIGAIDGSWSTSKLVLPSGAIFRANGASFDFIAGRGGLESIHPNELAGVLVLVVPLLLAQALYLIDARSGPLTRSRANSAWFFGAALTGVAASYVLLLTQSRSGFLGGASAIALLGGAAVVRLGRTTHGSSPLARVGAVAAYCCLVGTSAVFALRTISSWTNGSPDLGELDTLPGRLELWQASIVMLQDFPLSGIGLGQFSPVLHALYSPLLIPPTAQVPHAHNLILEYALELGLFGAAAFVTLVVAALRSCMAAIASADPLLRWTGLGLCAGIAGYFVYGLTDAIAPGARGGLPFWGVLGLAAAVGGVARNATVSEGRSALSPSAE